MKNEANNSLDDEETVNYKIRKQNCESMISKRFGIQVLLIDEYSDIPKILAKIEAII